MFALFVFDVFALLLLYVCCSVALFYFIVVCWIIGGLWRAFYDSPNYGTPYPGSDRDNPMNEGR